MQKPHRCSVRTDGINQYVAAQAVVATNGKPAAIAVLKATLIHTALHEVPYQMETTADGDVRITLLPVNTKTVRLHNHSMNYGKVKK